MFEYVGDIFGGGLTERAVTGGDGVDPVLFSH